MRIGCFIHQLTQDLHDAVDSFVAQRLVATTTFASSQLSTEVQRHRLGDGAHRHFTEAGDEM